jgi:hypothetical protein
MCCTMLHRFASRAKAVLAVEQKYSDFKERGCIWDGEVTCRRLKDEDSMAASETPAAIRRLFIIFNNLAGSLEM